MSDYLDRKDAIDRMNRDLKAREYALPIIFAVGIGWIAFWFFEVFNRQDYNFLALLLGTWMIIWGLSVANIKEDDYKYNFHFKLPDFLHQLNCFLPLPRCEDTRFELITVFHFIGYLLVGYLVPDLYVEILLVSIGFEIFESLIGYTPKIILDPTVNLLGYWYGSLMHHSAMNSL